MTDTAELRKIVRDAELAYRAEVDLAQAKILERYRTLSLAQAEYDAAKAEFDSNENDVRHTQDCVDVAKMSGYFVNKNDRKGDEGWNSHPYFSLKRGAYEARMQPQPNQDTISRLSLGKPSRELLRLIAKPRFYWRAAPRKALNQAVEAVANTLNVDVTSEHVVRGWSSREWNAVRARGGKKLGRLTSEQLMCRYANVEAPWITKVSGSKWEESERDKLQGIIRNTRQQTSWIQVSQYLNTGRSPLECFRKVIEMEGVWKAGAWDEAETARLVRLVEKFGRTNWATISLIIGNRSAPACRSRYEKRLLLSLPGAKKGRWTPAEDMMLKEAMEKMGDSKNWCKIEQLVPGRNDVQCRERYMSVGFRKLKSSWTRWNWREDCLLIVLINTSTNWNRIEHIFRARRSLKQCQKRWKRMADYKQELAASGQRRFHPRKSFSAASGWYPRQVATPDQLREYIEKAAQPISSFHSIVPEDVAESTPAQLQRKRLAGRDESEERILEKRARHIERG